MGISGLMPHIPKTTVLHWEMVELNPQHPRGVQIFPNEELWQKEDFAIPCELR